MIAAPDIAAEGGPARLHLLRITIEAVSPLSIGTGDAASIQRKSRSRDGRENAARATTAVIQRDADGIPAIPGSSVQGVLRRLYSETCPDRDPDILFGREDRDGEGRAGRLTVGWGYAHDSLDRCPRGLRCSGIGDDGEWSDPVLKLLGRPHPLWRDHVALSARHAVDGARKFARTAVPPGARFSLEIAGWGDESLAEDMAAVAALFAHPRFRLGGASRRGYGQFRLVRASRCSPDLANPRTLRELRAAPASTPLDETLTEACRAAVADTATTLRLDLTCPDFLRFGGETEECGSIAAGTAGARDLRDGADPARIDADKREDNSDGALTLLREPRIEYRNGVGAVVERLAPRDAKAMRFPAPAAAIKGALAHRTLYHANRAAGRTIDVDAFLKLSKPEREQRLASMCERPAELAAFLGSAKGPPRPDGSPGGGMAARMTIDDSEATGADWVVAIDHVVIDRFTGGARGEDGLLFAEEALLGARLSVTIAILPPPEGVACADGVGGWPQTTVADAFLRAVHDLCRGRLALGARSLGACHGSVAFEGAAAQAWIAAAARIGLRFTDGAAS